MTLFNIIIYKQMLWLVISLLLIQTINARKLILHAGAGHKIGTTQVVISPINGPYSIELYDVDDTLICINNFNKMSVTYVDDVCVTSNVQNLNGVYVITMEHPSDEYGTVEAHLIVNGRKTIENIPGSCPNGSQWRCDQDPTEPPTTTQAPTVAPTPGPTVAPTLPPVPTKATAPVYYNIRYVYYNYYTSPESHHIVLFLIFGVFVYYLYSTMDVRTYTYYHRPNVLRYNDYKNNIKY